jgi:hypothetical protein
MTDITKTRVDLIERAATELGALTSGQALSDEDATTIGALLDPLTLQRSSTVSSTSVTRTRSRLHASDCFR